MSTLEEAAATDGPTAPLPKDPQPTVDRIDELARRILTGDIVLPKFQRGFVWERPKILSLLDSVTKNFPIGSVLLWQSTQELRSENRIGELDIELPRPGYPVNYLLDGQQRLSSICGAMFWKQDDANSRWNIAYDLRTTEFVHLDALDEPPLHMVRINKLADPAKFFQHVARLAELEDAEELERGANGFFNRFKDYKIATVTLGDMSLQDVAPIFERINSTATPLTIVDLMRAATWSPEFDLVDAIDSILDDLSDKNFEGVDRKVILRNLSATSGGGFSTESIEHLRELAPEVLTEAVATTSEAYKKMADFLSTHIRVAGAQVIPYSNQLTVLGELFRRIPSPTAPQFVAIEHWFWKTALAGYFSGWNTGNMASDLAAVRRFAEGATDEIEVAGLTRPGPDIWEKRQFRLNNAHAKLLAIVLAHHHPIDLLTGQAIDTTQALAWENSKEFHHFFPQRFLKDKLGLDPRRINALSNIIMLSSASNKRISGTRPSVYLDSVIEAAAAAGAEINDWLARNLISPEAFAAAHADDYEAFLRLRSETIHAQVLPMAGWEA
jgi:hypothetical protein